jgi:hypothetical protein
MDSRLSFAFGDASAATELPSPAPSAARLPHSPIFGDPTLILETFPKLTSIETSFNREAPENRRNPVNSDKVQNLLWTIEQRKIVKESAVTITDTEDLKEKVSVHGLGIICN